MGDREALRSRRPALPLSSSSLATAQGRGQAKPAIAGGGGDSGPLARVGLERVGAPGPERGGTPDATAGGGGASATSLPHGRRPHDLVRRGCQGRRRRDRIGSRRRGQIDRWSAVGTVVGATRRQLGRSAGFYPCLALDSTGNYGETLDLLGIERWRRFSS